MEAGGSGNEGEIRAGARWEWQLGGSILQSLPPQRGAVHCMWHLPTIVSTTWRVPQNQIRLTGALKHPILNPVEDRKFTSHLSPLQVSNPNPDLRSFAPPLRRISAPRLTMNFPPAWGRPLATLKLEPTNLLTWASRSSPLSVRQPAAFP